jgi:hypothetical protein
MAIEPAWWCAPARLPAGADGWLRLVPVLLSFNACEASRPVQVTATGRISRGCTDRMLTNIVISLILQ